LETEKILSELAELNNKIIYYKDLLSSIDKIRQVVKTEIQELSTKYGDRRRTEITNEELGGMILEDFIKEEDVVVVISNRGFVKRVPVEEYKSQGRGGRGVRGVTLRDEDFIEHLFVASTHEHVMVVTNHGKAYWIKVHQLPVGSKTSKGESIKRNFPFEEGEEITSIINFKDFDESLYLLMVTRNGVAKKVNLSLFRNAKTRGIIAIILDEDDVLVNCELVSEGDDCMIITRKGKGLRFADSDVRAMGRASRGVRGINLIEDDEVAGLLKVSDDRRILMITEKGQGKQIHFDEFRIHRRGTMGQKIYTFRDKTGFIVGTLAVNDDDDVVCITSMGQSIRIPVATISIQKAYASGVTVARLKEGDTIVAIAKTDAEKEEEEIEEALSGEVEEIENPTEE
jgi:DNA gyrase subunit A